MSRALTSYGAVVAEGSLRGDLAESQTGLCVLTIGLFDGIAALRVAADLLGVQVLGHVSVEPFPRHYLCTHRSGGGRRNGQAMELPIWAV